ncbi:hypothetical protein QUF80_20385 [Desulfococcaceae bacterium HSG8]|nr:hypothetical protein [Desulfococcaceae bacterium HSG8]
MQHSHSADIAKNTVTSGDEPQNMLRGVVRLLLCVLVILLFMFGVAPLMERAPFIRPIVQFIEERDIDAGALYYTDIEEFSEAAIHMENTMDYPPLDRPE